MKFRKLNIQLFGADLYVDAECKMAASIEARIKDGLRAIEAQKLKDSVPNQFKPGNGFDDLFGTFFRQ